ncbi:N-acetylglucosamine-6-phosphate deacetylase [Enemella sp. A6]|uniref:N-acetylglucosamine-6-phosphate deacetylase n=1 Tax=Enemella sp. A6 TaxID=3440152 RepID=UPI003EBE657A
MLITSERILTDAGDPAPGWLDIDGDRITEVGRGTPPRQADLIIDGLLIPGYVDAHCHGGGGAEFGTTDPADVDTGLQAHLRHGTTSIVASLVTNTIDALREQVRLLVPRVQAGDLQGIHLEGPWLAEKYKGAHPADLLSDPDPAAVNDLLQAGEGTIRMVTLAPERQHSMSVIRLLNEQGVMAAFGHSDANYQQTKEAIAAGARGVTHLFNAMPALRHREPGPILAALEDPSVTLELIFDGVHVATDLCAFVMRSFPDRVALITDAMAAAGGGDGDYMLGNLSVNVCCGVARLDDGKTIAGSTLTLDQAVRNAVAAGIPVGQAVHNATAIPARYLGLTDVGSIAPGKRADLVVLDDDLQVQRVMLRGSWVGTEVPASS